MRNEKPLILLSLAASNPITYGCAIRFAGGIPVGGYLPDCEIPVDFDGLLLGGGGDLDPAWYGEENRACHELDHKRDEIEYQLIRETIARKKPVLGICRGIQVLNGVLGGDLIQDLGMAHSMVEGTYRLHAAHSKVGSKIEQLYGKEGWINSGHHQAVKNLAPGFTATQWAYDGVVEAMEHESLPILGVQWHPERMCNDSKIQGVDGTVLFSDFIESCKNSVKHTRDR